MVLRENVPTPVFSHLPAKLGDRLRAIPGVRAVAPEVWGLPPTIGNVSLIAKTADFLSKNPEQRLQGMLDATIIQGQDIAAHQGLKSAVYPSALKEGRFLTVADVNSKNIVISRKIAKEHKDASGKAKQVGDPLKIGREVYSIIGIYDTGSFLLDPVIVMDIKHGPEDRQRVAPIESPVSTSRPTTRTRSTRSPSGSKTRSPSRIPCSTLEAWESSPRISATS